MKGGALVATGDGEGDGVTLEKSSNLLGERNLWAELPGSAGVSKDNTPKLNVCIYDVILESMVAMAILTLEQEV